MLIFIVLINCSLYSQSNKIQIEYIYYVDTEFPSTLNCKSFFEENQSVFKIYMNSYKERLVGKNLNIIKEDDLSDTQSIISPSKEKDLYIKFDFDSKTLELIDNFVVFEMMRVEDNFPNNIWTITEESKQFGNYKLYKSITKYRGRDWEVWFTPDLPFSIGPWKLQGLPGAILEAQSLDGRFQFVATKVSFEDVVFEFPDENLKEITYQKLFERFEQIIYNNNISDFRDVTTEVSPRNGLELKYEWEE